MSRRRGSIQAHADVEKREQHQKARPDFFKTLWARNLRDPVFEQSWPPRKTVKP